MDELKDTVCENVDMNDGFCCSNCGCTIFEGDLTFFSEIAPGVGMMRHYPKYCPNCGARVVG